MRRILSLLILFSLLLTLSGCVSRLFYYPDGVLYQIPSQRKLEFEEVYFRSKDGTKLYGWFVKAIGNPIGTVIHFHGNAQNMSAHFSFVDWLPSEGFNVFTFDYRGYGASQGNPSRQGIYEDCLAAIEYVQKRTDIDQKKIVILGQSLGGANAIAVIGSNDFKGIKAVAIESTFYSYRSIVRDKMERIFILSPLKWPLSFIIVSNKYSPSKVIDKVSPIPFLLIHGNSDQVIPYHHSKLLFDRAKQPKKLWTVEKGKHSEAFTKYGYIFRKILVHFYKDALENSDTHPE